MKYKKQLKAVALAMVLASGASATFAQAEESIQFGQIGRAHV